MDKLRSWLECDCTPGNYYELLGEPLFTDRREVLLSALHSTTKRLHQYQNHKLAKVVEQARSLELLCAKAARTFSNDDAWQAYDQALLERLRREYETLSSRSAASQPMPELRQWLVESHEVVGHRLEEIVGCLSRPSVSAGAETETLSPQSTESPCASRTSHGSSTEQGAETTSISDSKYEVPSSGLPALRPPFVISHYEVIESLGSGGIGLVYKARHIQLQKLVAIKLLRNDRQVDATSIARFQREMVAIGKLNHANIVRATDAGCEGDTLFLVMDLIDGRNLHDVVQSRGPLPVAEACDIIRQTALGLQHAHDQGLVHRDIKPSNLMISRDGTVKILDLGLALLGPSVLNWKQGPGDPESELTAVGTIVGTIDYMAPEQLNGRRGVDARADIYSLGCTLFYLLTGQAVFRECGSDLFLRMAAHASQPVPRLTQYRSDAPVALADILQRMMAKAPPDRFQAAQDVVAALEDVLSTASRPATGGQTLPPVDGVATSVKTSGQEQHTPPDGLLPVKPRTNTRPPPPLTRRAEVANSTSVLASPAKSTATRRVPDPALSTTQQIATTMPMPRPPALPHKRQTNASSGAKHSAADRPAQSAPATRRSSGPTNLVLWCVTGALLAMTVFGGICLLALLIAHGRH